MAHAVELKEDVFEQLKEHCLSVYDEQRKMTVDELMIELMDHPEVPMHFPYHHFIIPGALLTLAALEDGSSRVELEDMLNVALSRSKNVLGGFCGNYGACGAGVGAGIFVSIYTDTSPMSEKSWQWANEVTGICLQHISTVPGPRCCKRTGFLSMQAAVDYLNEKLDLHLALNEHIVCKYADRNPDCKRELCPFFREGKEDGGN